MINLTGPLFLFTERLENDTINQWFTDRPMPLKQAKRLMKNHSYKEIHQWSNTKQGWVKIEVRK